MPEGRLRLRLRKDIGRKAKGEGKKTWANKYLSQSVTEAQSLFNQNL